MILGYQEGEALAELYSNAAAFVLPSDHEGMPVALLEAWSYGLPAVVSGIGPCREVGGEDGERCRYFTPGDADDLAANLQVVLADSQAREMGARAREHALANYGWEAIAARVEEQYRLAVGGRA
jgi:glycosyltransferase involved in cell wall biosynthesis